jgi:hypothetical protein
MPGGGGGISGAVLTDGTALAGGCWGALLSSVLASVDVDDAERLEVIAAKEPPATSSATTIATLMAVALPPLKSITGTRRCNTCCVAGRVRVFTNALLLQYVQLTTS